MKLLETRVSNELKTLKASIEGEKKSKDGIRDHFQKNLEELQRQIEGLLSPSNVYSYKSLEIVASKLVIFFFANTLSGQHPKQ